MQIAPLRIALIGMGTVGTGVARILTHHADRIARRAGRPIEIRRVVVEHVEKSRAIALPSGLIVDDLDAVYADKDIDVALHLVGGLEPARTIMLRLLESGKDVVTANKALLCEHGDEVFRRPRTWSHGGVRGGGRRWDSDHRGDWAVDGGESNHFDSGHH